MSTFIEVAVHNGKDLLCQVEFIIVFNPSNKCHLLEILNIFNLLVANCKLKFKKKYLMIELHAAYCFNKIRFNTRLNHMNSKSIAFVLRCAPLHVGAKKISTSEIVIVVLWLQNKSILFYQNRLILFSYLLLLTNDWNVISLF